MGRAIAFAKNNPRNTAGSVVLARYWRAFECGDALLERTFTGGGGQALVTCSTSITQTGSNLSFSNMEVTDLGIFGMGAATLTDNTFDGTNQHQSSGCGVVTNRYRGYFSGDGNIMNMTSTLTSDNCAEMDLRGEMYHEVSS